MFLPHRDVFCEENEKLKDEKIVSILGRLVNILNVLSTSISPFFEL